MPSESAQKSAQQLRAIEKKNGVSFELEGRLPFGSPWQYAKTPENSGEPVGQSPKQTKKYVFRNALVLQIPHGWTDYKASQLKAKIQRAISLGSSVQGKFVIRDVRPTSPEVFLAKGIIEGHFYGSDKNPAPMEIQIHGPSRKLFQIRLAIGELKRTEKEIKPARRRAPFGLDV
ncbi:MAG: hypothetical protein AABX01_07850 [Candidatus Micrarchaeota archaeon]